MGVWISKRRDGGSTSGSSSGAADGKLQYTTVLSSYEAACRADPEIETFDTGLQQRTSRVISNLAVNGQLRSLSFDALKDVTGNLLEMNQDVVRIILDCKKDIWKNPELFDLVEAYFQNSLHTLDFCTALEKCLMNARDSQLLVHLALKSFEEEDAVLPSAEDDDKSTERKGKAKYTRTLEELRRFIATGDPFKEEFFQAFQSVYRQQISMLEKLQQRKNKLDKKLKSVRAWRKVTCVLFGSAFAALIICSVVAALVAAPPIAAALAAASSVPLGSMGKWFDSMWKEYQGVLMAEKDLIGAMQTGTFLVITDLDSIRVLINRLEDHISSMLENAEFAFREEEAVRFGVEEIKKKLVEFMKSIEDLVKQADRCSRDIKWARTVVLQKIVNYP